MTQVRHAVTDFVWMGDHFIPPDDLAREVDLLGAGDPVALAARLWGQFALHQTAADEHVLLRDPLGVNKLFFAIDAHGGVVSSSFWIDLVRRGCPASAIWSVPSRHLLRVAPSQRRLQLIKYGSLPFSDDDQQAPTAEDVGGIQRALEATFARIRTAVAGRPLYVTLSGGLDSTTIAALARRHLGELTAVTFALADGGDEPEDLRYARRVAADLRVPLRVVRATADELIAHLDVALCCGQDWRDFNVHCALVNAAIGSAIGATEPRPVLLTGDVMNELMADYAPVTYRGHEYYALPRIEPGRLRRFLVQGLDAGDREVGVFAHFGLDVLQPYALCADAYARIPRACLDRPEAKQHLVRAVMGDAIPSYVYDRRKVRAQVGGADEVRGTLAALVDRGIDGAWLERRFCALFDVDPAQLRSAIRAGLYRFPTSYPSSVHST
ncbi:MAG TPA: asparagine synthase-related protein [Kofleriaceae bacterium]|jgi:asparagine synthetase B (glutamine-hydrolysing)|nr:asparagine synthase-related protein [Kofleriaceae bacterium]